MVCFLFLAALLATANPSPAPAVAPAAAVQEERARFVSQVKDAVLLGFDEKEHCVRFRPAVIADPAHQPGLLEDVALEAFIRGRLAADPPLQTVHFTVECQAGNAALHGQPENVQQAIELANLVLATPNVREASLELPRSLWLAPPQNGPELAQTAATSPTAPAP
jgi:hypothetical protein